MSEAHAPAAPPPQRTEPALYVTTQTTLPVLTQLMAAFSLAAVGIVASSTWSTTIPFLQLTTKEISLGLFATSVFLFVIATESCIKSHSWDYFSVSDERRKFWNLSTDPPYIEKCLKLSKLWHSRAVWFFRVGVFLSILGAAFLVWPLSRMTSWLIAGYLPVSIAISLWVHHREKKAFEKG